MARPRNSEALDLSKPCNLTVGVIERLMCPPGRAQAFLRDAEGNGLRVRVTPNGSKSFVFEQSLNNKTIRRTIGGVSAWSIEGARAEAKRLSVMLDAGTDPRELERQRRAAEAEAAQVAAAKKESERLATASKQAAEKAESLTVAEVWPRYMAEGKPKRRAAWKPRYVLDLNKAASLGGEPKKRGKGTTRPGPLAALMPLALKSIDQDVIAEWFAAEAKAGQAQAVRAVAMFSGFLRWCSTKKDLRALVVRDAARASELGDVLPPKPDARKDAIEQAQLPGWFKGTDKLRSRPAAAYLQALVLTGARREELAGLRWVDVDFQWNKLTLADKVDATRVIPLTPYMAWLLAGLPRATLGKGPKKGEPNPYVFSSNMSTSGRLAEPRAPHADVLADAGIPHVSIHGLRRTFSLMGEAAGAPAGAIAQVMGHKPSAVAEGYRPRSIDALRPYLAQIERFILNTAEVEFDAEQAKPGGLRAVA